jgi:hypothetical protein
MIFSAPEVRAILEGRKTQTRRPLNPQPIGDELDFCDYQPGDTLWVREKFRLVDFEYVDGDVNASAEFADGSRGSRIHGLTMDEPTGWRASIHMPRWASRITLRVTDIPCERLRDITEEDARAEGMSGIDEFREHWDMRYGKRVFDFRWENNPWVWVIGFEREA